MFKANKNMLPKTCMFFKEKIEKRVSNYSLKVEEVLRFRNRMEECLLCEIMVQPQQRIKRINVS